MHGKVAPQLPFVLYRAIVMVPVLAFVFAMVSLCLASSSRTTMRWLARTIFMAVAVGLVWSALVAYRYCKVFEPVRPPEAAELVILRLMRQLPEVGLGPGSEVVLLEKTGDYKFQRIPALSQYFLSAWIRPERPEASLWIENQRLRRPGVVFVRPDDSLANETPSGYKVRKQRFGGHEDPLITPEIIGLVYLPRSGDR
jgi:hypothetical protein